MAEYRQIGIGLNIQKSPQNDGLKMLSIHLVKEVFKKKVKLAKADIYTSTQLSTPRELSPNITGPSAQLSTYSEPDPNILM